MYFVKCTSPACSKAPQQHNAATPVLHSWDGVLRLASLPLFPPSIMMDIVAKQIYFCFIRPEDISPKSTIFVLMCSCKSYTKLVIEPIRCYTKIQRITHENKNCGAIMSNDNPYMIQITIYLVLSDIILGVLMLKCCISIFVHLAIHLQHIKTSTNGFHAPKLDSEMQVINMTLVLLVSLYVLSGNGEERECHCALFTLLYHFQCLGSYGKKNFWKVLLHSYNVCLDEFPCRSWLKVPETKCKTSSAHSRTLRSDQGRQ
uniref:Uncharacterized protein n=1 Tax=Oncorhynchus mykiss TaxID=8022 RepID=A0A8C7S268_ONCMY